ncbi:MAG TPA: MFS transporter, partial [Candidatus Methylomirabilis sp.]|nr:MFS transporter [Candidatus Methylomirabilis sp.]
LFSIGQGAVLPIVPLFALELGASVAAASLVVGMRGLGLMLFDLPSGVVVSRFGDKGAMVAGTAMVAAAAIGASLTRSVTVLAVFILIMGGGWAFWQVARLAYVSEVVPTGQLGRAMSLLGGASRVGTFVGPVLGGYLAQYYGFESALYAQAALGLAASVMMFLVVQKGSGSEDLGGHGIAGRLVATVVQHRHVFLSAGLALIALQVLRQGRQIFLPLWGDVVGLDVATIGLVYGISSLADAGLFYPMGYIMDRWGRKWASVPSLLTLSLGLLLLPVTSEVYGYALVAILMGIGNGFGAGIAMTLGVDFTPVQRRGEFLGVWRFVNDAGNSGGPFLVSFITSVASLGLASIFSAGLGIAGGVVMWLLVPETLQRVNPSGIKASEPSSSAERASEAGEPAKPRAAPPG